MTTQDINKCRDEARQLLAQSRVVECIRLLTPWVAQTGDYTMQGDFEQITTSYGYLLKYVAQGVNDPSRGDILADINQQLYRMIDRCVIALNTGKSYELFYTRAQAMANVSLPQLLQQYRTTLKKEELLRSVPDQQNATALAQLRQSRERVEVNIFNAIWCRYPLPATWTVATDEFLADTAMPAHFKCLIISALYLGLNKFYDGDKLRLLLQAYQNCSDMQVQVRALTAAVLAIGQHSTRVAGSRRLKELIDQASVAPNFGNDLTSIFYRLIRSRNTERITRKMREDLMPNILKMRPDMLRQVRKRGGVFDLSDFEANPEWQELLDKSGITKKMQELNEFQIEGDDVFISTFSHLKSFPFFNTLANWFMPYRDDLSVIDNFLPASDKGLRALINATPFMCDSDKYSFCFTMASLPESQREMMRQQLNSQIANIKEMRNADETDDDKNRRDRAINCYIQDLYRFFKLYSRRGEFTSVFNTPLNLLQLPFFSRFINNKLTLTMVAEFYLKNGFYPDAITYYEHLLATFPDTPPITYQKIGFAYQSMGKYREAIDNYKRYELVNDQSVWTMKNIATCYRLLKDVDHALAYYQKADALSPNTPAIVLNLGHCLLEQGKVDEALQHYYQVDLLDEKKHRAWRPIAWCTFLKKDYAQSAKYYGKILDAGMAQPQDHMNYGHMLLCSGNTPKAMEQYKQSVQTDKEGLNDFLVNYREDEHYLLDQGLDRETLSLIAEAVAFATLTASNQRPQ